jgi:oligoendopeptidase F
MAREKKAGDAPKKRNSRGKTPVEAAEIKQQSPENGKDQTLQVGSAFGVTKQTISIGDEEVRRRAYEIWEQRGKQHGKDADDWYRAESEIRGKSA